MIIKSNSSEEAINNLISNMIKIDFGRYQKIHIFRNGHTILKPLDKNNPKLYVIYKREYYNSFSNQFSRFYKEHTNMGYIADSININAVDSAINRNCDYIVFIHPDNVYIGYPMLIKRFCERYNLIRIQNKTNKYKDNNNREYDEKETTYSFPVSLLKPFEEVIN